MGGTDRDDGLIWGRDCTPTDFCFRGETKSGQVKQAESLTNPFN